MYLSLGACVAGVYVWIYDACQGLCVSVSVCVCAGGGRWEATFMGVCVYALGFILCVSVCVCVCFAPDSTLPPNLHPSVGCWLFFLTSESLSGHL